MKNVIFVCLFLVTAVAFAQGTELDPSFSAIKAFFLPSLGVSALVLWSDTVKHIKSGTWELSIFLKTKLLPFVLTQAVAVGIYLLLAYVPFTKPFIEVLAGSEIGTITAGALVGTASAIIDGIIKKPAEE